MLKPTTLLAVALVAVLVALVPLGAQAEGKTREVQLPRIGPLDRFANLSDADLQVVLQRVRQNIRDSADDVKRIVDFVLSGEGKGQAYNRLAEWTDTFGSRISGSSSHRNAVLWLEKALIEDKLENVHREAAMVPRWVRGHEAAVLVKPRVYQMNVLGLGTSVGIANTTAEAIVVKTFDELHSLAAQNQTQGKIIVFNQYCDWDKYPVACYGMSVQYRSSGASEASKAGGIAALIRTVGAFSINSPHTGAQFYSDGVKKVPAMCITIEDAEMFQRMQDRGQKLEISIQMDAKNYPLVESHNLVAEWTGTTYPEELVLVSGHLDSWDVGQGAMDDGGGAFVSWQALSTLRQLNLRAKRTLRFVGWASEEFGGYGSQEYYKVHKSNASHYDLVMESDMGVFKAQGIEFTGSDAATAVMNEVMAVLKPYGLSLLTKNGGGEDIGPWMNDGVPGASLKNENDRYFWFHHSHGDMMTVLNADDMDLCVIAWTVSAYTVANLDDMLPRSTAVTEQQMASIPSDSGMWVKGK